MKPSESLEIISLPIQNMSDLEADYRSFLADARAKKLDLGKWLPTLGKAVRGIVPGELITILASTGVGKTAILQNIALACAPLETLLFELELPGTMTFERFVGMASRMNGAAVEHRYDHGEGVDWENDLRLKHIHVCSLSKLTTEKIEELIVKSEKKIGAKPALVMVDYMTLVAGKGNSRYERVSCIAEELKVIAKSTNTIMLVASQVHRREDNGEVEVSLFDAKESGSIENSSGLVLGAWRESSSLMKIKILKNSKGKPGLVIPCDVIGETLQIQEMHRGDDKR